MLKYGGYPVQFSPHFYFFITQAQFCRQDNCNGDGEDKDLLCTWTLAKNMKQSSQFLDCYEKADCDIMDILKCVQDKKWGQWEWKDAYNDCVKAAKDDEIEMKVCLNKAGVIVCLEECMYSNSSKIRNGFCDLVAKCLGSLLIMNILSRQ